MPEKRFHCAGYPKVWFHGLGWPSAVVTEAQRQVLKLVAVALVGAAIALYWDGSGEETGAAHLCGG